MTAWAICIGIGLNRAPAKVGVVVTISVSSYKAIAADCTDWPIRIKFFDYHRLSTCPKTPLYLVMGNAANVTDTIRFRRIAVIRVD